MAAAANSPLPLTTLEFVDLMRICDPFEGHPMLAVAVSGGADSMALLLMVDRWTKAQGGHTIALTVDHGLRRESATEARQVAQWCKMRDIEHHILTWNPPALTSAIQAQARDARYCLLTDWCRTHHILHLLTAHHRDDQAETLFFRLGRGSQLDGLACMPTIGERQGIRLLRPLLSIPKARLEETLTELRQSWINDPSNLKPHYTRNRIRQVLRESEGPALSQQATQIADRLGQFRNLLEYKLASYSTESISVLPEGYGILHRKAFQALPVEYGLRTLSNLIMTVSGDSYPPRSEKLQRLYDDIVGERITRQRSFASCLLIDRPREQRLLVCREPKAIEAPRILSPNVPCYWDCRFQITCGNVDGLHIRALGRDGLAQLTATRFKPSLKEKPVLITLPAFWNLETLLFVPHIQYRHPAFDPAGCTARFLPAKTLAGPAFSGKNKG